MFILWILTTFDAVNRPILKTQNLNLLMLLITIVNIVVIIIPANKNDEKRFKDFLLKLPKLLLPFKK